MSDKLKPCPFCGGEVEILTEEVDATREVYNFHCDNCDMSTYYDYSDKEEAIKHWNTRKPIDRVVEQLENEEKFWESSYDYQIGKEKARSYRHAIELVKAGGIDG